MRSWSPCSMGKPRPRREACSSPSSTILRSRARPWTTAAQPTRTWRSSPRSCWARRSSRGDSAMRCCTRRSSMKAGALALLGVGSIPRFLVRTAYAQGTAARPKVLIAVFQRGAVDGLSMIVPHGDPSYYGSRGSIAVARPAAGNNEASVDLDGFFGLHPAMGSLRPLWDDRRLAIVHACGSPDTTRSHFDAQDYMESGTPGVKSTPDGWLARGLEATPRASASPFRAVAMGTQLPRTLRGDIGAVAMGAVADFDVKQEMRGAAASVVNPRRGFESLYEQGVHDV